MVTHTDLILSKNQYNLIQYLITTVKLSIKILISDIFCGQ
jgi:hypothetical protein